MKLVGLKFDKSKPTNVAGVKIYRYRLDQTSLTTILDTVTRRSSPNGSGWEFVNQLYGFSYTDHETAWLIQKSQGYL